MRIFMRVRYRGIWVLDLLFLLAFAVLVMLSYSSFAAGAAGNGTGFLMVALFLAVADATHYFHGLWITPKKVITFSPEGLFQISYEEVSKITVTFEPSAISAVIRCRGKEHKVEWIYVWLSGGSIATPIHCWAKVNDRIIQKATAQLSQCPKVVIRNEFHREDTSKKSIRK